MNNMKMKKILTFKFADHDLSPFQCVGQCLETVLIQDLVYKLPKRTAKKLLQLLCTGFMSFSSYNSVSILYPGNHSLLTVGVYSLI